MIIKETKYLVFDAYNLPGKKMKIVKVINKSSGNELAEIQWYGPWRQYCFMPTIEFDTVWNSDCLNDINSVITMLMRQRKVEKQNAD